LIRLLFSQEQRIMNLPVTIDLPTGTPDDPEPGVFTRARQVKFLEGLATSGAVRSASAAAGVSYRTAYRERRANPAFRRAWDAALLSARAMSEDVLATRAIEGVEEDVLYHGEVVATRRRYDARLLLAHLARLDKLTEDARTRAFADDYEGALERFAAGIDDPAPVCEACGEALPLGVDEATGEFAPGQCDKCDTPALHTAGAAAPASAPARRIEEPCPDCGGACLGPEEHLTEADCRWLGNRLDRMKAARPAGAKGPYEFCGHDLELVEMEQLQAFEQGVERWWLVVPPDPDDDPAEWRWLEE
jgi:hypothetical protein